MTTNDLITVTITDDQRALVVGGLYDTLLESNRYLSPHLEEYPQPGPMDTCCDAHRARYDHNRQTHGLLLAKKQRIESLIELLERAGETTQHSQKDERP